MPITGQRYFQKGSVCHKIAEYFRDNPDEALTYADMSIKFDCPEATARAVVFRLKRRGILVAENVVKRTL